MADSCLVLCGEYNFGILVHCSVKKNPGKCVFENADIILILPSGISELSF